MCIQISIQSQSNIPIFFPINAESGVPQSVFCSLCGGDSNNSSLEPTRQSQHGLNNHGRNVSSRVQGTGRGGMDRGHIMEQVT